MLVKSKFIKCPKCGTSQDDSIECRKCGIIFEKYNKIKFTSNPDNKKSSSDSNKPQGNSFTIASILFLFLIFFDGYFVYNNEFTRPKRERYYSTLDLIETSVIQNYFEELNYLIYSLHDQHKRSSIIFKLVEDGCNELNNEVYFNKTNNSIRCIFPDNSSFSYSAITRNVKFNFNKPKHETLFSFFPNLINLHMIYKDIDYDSGVYELHSMYPNLNYSIIEKKFNKLSESNYYRLFISAFIIWFIPTLLYFLIKK